MIEGRGFLLEGIGGGTMDILFGLPFGARSLAAAEILIREAFPEEALEASCLVGDLLGD